MTDQGERPLGGGTGFKRFDFVDETGGVEEVKIKLIIANNPTPMVHTMTPSNGSANWAPTAIAGVNQVETSVKINGNYLGWASCGNLSGQQNVQYCQASAVTSAPGHLTAIGALPEGTM